MNYITTLVSILQDKFQEDCFNKHTDNYIVILDVTRTRRRLEIRENDHRRNLILELYIGSEMFSDDVGLKHYNMKLNDKPYQSWYQMKYPSDPITHVSYLDATNFVDIPLFDLDINSDEDIFQKSTIHDIDMKMINSLILEYGQLSPNLAKSDEVFLIISQYETVDFNQIYEALQCS